MSSNSNDGSSCVDDMAKNADPNLAKLCGDKELSELRESDAGVEDPKVTRWTANEWKSIRAKDLMNNKDPKSMPSEIEKGRPNRAAPMINAENATWTQLRRNEDERAQTQKVQREQRRVKMSKAMQRQHKVQVQEIQNKQRWLKACQTSWEEC